MTKTQRCNIDKHKRCLSQQNVCNLLLTMVRPSEGVSHMLLTIPGEPLRFSMSCIPFPFSVLSKKQTCTLSLFSPERCFFRWQKINPSQWNKAPRDVIQATLWSSDNYRTAGRTAGRMFLCGNCWVIKNPKAYWHINTSCISVTTDKWLTIKKK